MNLSHNTLVSGESGGAVRNTIKALCLAILAVGLDASISAQSLLYQENFNTEGEGTRYTVEGRGFVPKNGQVTPVPAGSSYWSRNVDVTANGEAVGVPFPAPARRAVISFNHRLDPTFLTADGKKLLTGVINWLTDGKKNMVIMFSNPRGVGELDLGDSYLADTLTAASHTVIDDDAAEPLAARVTAQKVDLIINSSTGGDPIRLANTTVPMLSFAHDITGDLLLSTRGLIDINLDPGEIKVEAISHPSVAGLPANFKFVSDAQPFDAPGLGLPPGSLVVASYQYTDPETGVASTRPFVVVTDKGVQLLGGLISGMEGTGFWAGADLNEANISGGTFNTITEPRSLTLKEVDVAGKPKLKLTLALAATEVDFDAGADDFFSIKIDPDGAGPSEFIELARYGSPTGSEKFYIEMLKGGVETKDYSKRVGIVAKDITYDIPSDATKLVVRFESNSTFWNEIVAFDNIRITSGDIVAKPPTIAFAKTGDDLTLTWEGSTYTLETTGTLPSGWTVIPNAASGHKAKANSGSAYFRLKSK